MKENMLSIASEKKETIGSMADARPKGRSNRLFFSLQRRSLTFSFIMYAASLDPSGWGHRGGDGHEMGPPLFIDPV